VSLNPKAVRAAAKRRPPVGSATPEDIDRLQADALTKAELAASEPVTDRPSPVA
jgi:hypothetical protein